MRTNVRGFVLTRYGTLDFDAWMDHPCVAQYSISFVTAETYILQFAGNGLDGLQSHPCTLMECGNCLPVRKKTSATAPFPFKLCNTNIMREVDNFHLLCCCQKAWHAYFSLTPLTARSPTRERRGRLPTPNVPLPLPSRDPKQSHVAELLSPPRHVDKKPPSPAHPTIPFQSCKTPVNILVGVLEKSREQNEA